MDQTGVCKRLTPVGFITLQHIRNGKSTLIPKAYLTLYVPLSGFDYPLNGLLLPLPLDHFSGPSVLGVYPSEFSSL
jgi:hypothetical protein